MSPMPELFSFSLQNLGNLFLLMLAISVGLEFLDRLTASKHEAEVVTFEVLANDVRKRPQ